MRIPPKTEAQVESEVSVEEEAVGHEGRQMVVGRSVDNQGLQRQEAVVGLVIHEDVLRRLTKKELHELEKYQGKPGLALTIQAQFFELFLNGSSCEEIHRLNPNFPFGAIVRARIEGLWDNRKDSMVAHALDSVRDRVEQTQIAAINFNADMLAAAHKQFGDRFKKYLQTGEEESLGNVRIDSIRQYKEAIEMWLKLTGQENKRQLEVVNVGEQKQVTKRVPNPDEAGALLAQLLSEEKK